MEWLYMLSETSMDPPEKRRKKKDKAKEKADRSIYSTKHVRVKVFQALK